MAIVIAKVFVLGYLLSQNNKGFRWCPTDGSSSLSVQTLRHIFLWLGWLGMVCMLFGQGLFLADRPWSPIMAYTVLWGRFGEQGLHVETRPCSSWWLRVYPYTESDEEADRRTIRGPWSRIEPMGLLLIKDSANGSSQPTKTFVHIYTCWIKDHLPSTIWLIFV